MTSQNQEIIFSLYSKTDIVLYCDEWAIWPA